MAQAIAQFRQGDTADAVESLRETQTHEGYSQTLPVQAITLSLMALCEHEHGRLNEANRALADATNLIEANWPKLLKDEFGGQVAEWLIAETLRREAERLILAEKGQVQPTSERLQPLSEDEQTGR